MLKFAKEDLKLLLASLLIVVLGFSGFYIAYAAEDIKTSTLTASVVVSLTFSVSTDVFGSITAGSSAKFATSTLAVNTNAANGWQVTLYGNNQGSDSASTTMYLVPTTYATNITDQTEWVPGSATSSAGNAVQIGSLINTQNVLAFRMMTASSTNGTKFYAPTWWGSADTYIDSASTLWAGIASSTIQRQIGNSSIPSNGNVINTALYYLKVASTQAGGDYTGGLTFTANSN